jgi:hypothetical protein
VFFRRAFGFFVMDLQMNYSFFSDGDARETAGLKRILQAVLCGLCLSFSIAAAPETENVVKNSSFEDGAKGGPRGGSRRPIRARPILSGHRLPGAAVRFRAGGSTDNASLSLGMRGPEEAWIGAVSLMPANNIKGMRADTLNLLKQLGGTIYRWPAGSMF